MAAPRLHRRRRRFSEPRAMTAASEHPTQANAERRYTVKRTDLPLSCPLPSMALWNSHPRVYLPVEAEGECRCPYCGAHFILED
jgi:uncharacterized Zn-finger protein